MLALAAALAVIVACWYESRQQSREILVSELAAIAAFLQEDRGLLNNLQASSPDLPILPAYLANVRTDGVAKHADAKQKLDRLAENNEAILALINVHAPRAESMAFKEESHHFQRYAIAWRDRWNSVMELFMAGGNYPVAEVAFPAEFAGAVEAEIAATRGKP